MSKCDIRIEVAKVNYKMGDTVKGVVYVDVDKECRCDGLVISKFWATHGRGNRNSGGSESLELFKGVWNAGIYSYPFAFTLEEGPLTYRGNYINIDWYLKASADIPWALDPRETKEFIVESSLATDDSMLESTHEAGDGTKKASSSGISPFIVMLFPLIVAAIGLYFMLVEFSFFLGGVFTFAGMVMTYKVIQSTLAERKLGRVVCELDSVVLRPGNNVKCSVLFTTRSQVNINGIEITLTGKEVAISGSGTNTSTHVYRFHEAKKSVARNGVVEKGICVNECVVFELPDDAAVSFKASANDIIWQVDVSIDILKWPDWIDTLPMTVVP